MKLALATTNATLPETEGYEPVSADSRAVSRRWAAERNYLRQTASDWAPVTLAAFEEIRRDCGSSNWDGEDAQAISPRTLALAKLVVAALYEMLPKGISPPEIVPEGDGEICLTWTPDEERMFSVSIGEHGHASFAGELGRNGGRHGWQPIATATRADLEDSLTEIAEHIKRIYRPFATKRPA